MGAAVTLFQASQLPPVIEREHFAALTNKQFKDYSYDHFADHNGKVSRERLLEIVSLTDCYLSHEWGIDKQGRNTSSRVRKINVFLQSKGFFSSFDEGQVMGMNAVNMIKDRVQKAQCVIVCMTERYFYQLKLPGDNPSKVEFYEAMTNKDLRCIIPIVLEPAAFHIPSLVSEQYPNFMHKTHLDFTNFADIGNDDSEQLSDLYLYVTRCIRPLREGGSYKQQRNQFLSTIVGRHYKWLIQHTPKFGHDLSLKYATAFGEQDIESATRLWQLLQHDITFLQKIKIPEKDAIAIRNALKTDIISNFDTLNAKRVDAQIAEHNRRLEEDLAYIQERHKISINMTVKYTELKLMSIEDERSRGFREQCRMDYSELQYVRGRETLLQLADAQHERYQETLLSMQELQRRRNINNDINYRKEDFMLIGRVTEPTVASGMLYKLFIKIDRATAHLHQEEVLLDNPEQSADLPEEYQNDYHYKRHRVQKYIDRSSFVNNSALVAAGEIPSHETWEGKDMTLEEKNSRLIFLLQEAAYICRAIVNVCQYNTHHVWELAESGVVKLLMALLAHVYLFNCPFESLFMPMSFHYLSMPTENLLAIRYMIKCGIGHRNINEKLGYLFGEAGAVDLCMEIVRFHLNDMNIASVAIELLYVLVDLPTGSDANSNLTLFMKDTSNFILLIVVLEKYQEYLSPVALSLHSCIIGIASRMALTGKYDPVLRAFRAHLISPITNSILPLIDDNSDPELCSRLCNILSDLCFSREYYNSHYFTSDFVPKTVSFARDMSKRLNYRVVLRFLKKMMTAYFDNDVVVIAAVIALGNIAFNNEKVKKEFFRMKLHDSLVKVLRVRMKRLDNAHPKWDTMTESIEVDIDAVNTREVLYEALITAANVIIVPPFLTYDTQRPEEGLTVDAEIVKMQLKNPGGSVTAAAIGNVKLPAAVASESPSCFAYFVEHGLSELVMNLITNYRKDRILMRSMLIFANKFMYRGRYLSTLRLVRLGFCEQMLLLLKDYAEDNELYMLGVMVMTSVLSSHPTLVGAAKRLITSDICELLVTTMRSQCLLHQCSQSRAWMHFSFPYTCRVCVVHCTAVYCCLMCDPSFSAVALARLREAQFHGMLQCPPPYLCDTLTLEAAVVPDGITTALINSVVDMKPSQGIDGENSQHNKPENSLVLFGSQMQVGEEDEDKFIHTGMMASEETKAKHRIITSGVFHVPSEVRGTQRYNSKDSGGVSSATLEKESYSGSVRNVDFVAYMTRKEKDHIMSTLFRFFDVE